MADEKPESSSPAAEASDRVAEKSIAAKTAVDAVKGADRVILRLNKLLSSPAGLSSFLSTSNYILYILVYLQPKLATLLKSPKPISTTLPPAAALATLLSKTRTNLRLLGTFPLYAWLRTLLAGPKPGADLVLHRIALLQASSYLTYQSLENMSVLADHGIVPASFIARLNRGDSKTVRLYLWAYRFWFAGVSCDFLRLAREAQLEGRRREARRKLREHGREVAVYQDEEDRRVDQKWWMDLVIASAWAPMAWHFSSAAGGVPGWNLGWMGLCGLVAGGQRFMGLWEATG